MSEQFSRFPEAALLLCGGKSRRMGSDKAWIDWKGSPLLKHVAEMLAQVIPRVHLMAAPGQLLPELPATIQIHRDTIAGAGAAAALIEGLDLLASCQSVWVSSVDAPEPQLPLIASLYRAINEPIDDSSSWLAAVPRQSQFAHPLAAVYRPRAAGRLRSAFDQGERRLQRLIEQLPVRWMDEDELRQHDPQLRTLLNLNTPEAYERAVQEDTEGAR